MSLSPTRRSTSLPRANVRGGCWAWVCTAAALWTAPLQASATLFPTPAATTAAFLAPVVEPPHLRPTPSPMVYRDLHPVRDPILTRWQQATVREMSGSSASPWYREVAAQLDVTWRLAELAPAPPTLDPTLRDQALDMAITGAFSGWNDVWQQTVRGAPELVPIHTILQSALTPSLQIRTDDEGTAQISSDARRSQNQQAAMADINQGPSPGRTGRSGGGPPLVRTGSALTLVRIPDRSDLDRTGQPRSPFSPGLSSWVDVRNVGVDAARVQTRIQQNPEQSRFRPQVRWVALARQGLLPNWDVIADLQGNPETALPERNAVALEHRLGSFGLPAWALRASALQQSRVDLGPQIREERLMVTLRTNLSWYLPQDVGRWPLGQRPLAPGPVMPRISPAGPENPRPLAQPPIERNGMTPPAEDGIAAR